MFPSTRSRLGRVTSGAVLVALVVAATPVDRAVAASVADGTAGGGARLSPAAARIVADDATFDLRRRLRGDPALDQLADSVSVVDDQELSSLQLADDAGAVSITPRATTDGPARRSVTIGISRSGLTLQTMGGGRKDVEYPPAAFAVTSHPLRSGHPGSGAVTVGTTSGRSSREVLPLFLVTDRDGSHGYWFSIGWSGSWQVTARAAGGGARLRFTVPMGSREGSDGAKIVMGTFAGDGWAAIKQYLASISRDIGPPPVVANTWYAHSADIDEATLLADIPVAASAGAEVYVIDAGWYSKPGARFSEDGLGTWAVDRVKFPHGLEPVIAAIRANGMRPGLWFEPERASRGSTLWKEHPDWLLHGANPDWALVDFGNPAVARWAVRLLDSAIERYGLEWIKWDFNIDPAPMWHGDAARELAHVEGVYRVMEEVRRDHPELWLEMCASGGNRIDSEMIRRADSYWISDQTALIDGQRVQSAEAATVLPARFRYTGMAQSAAKGTTPRSGTVFPTEAWLTAMSGTFGIMEPFADWSAPVRAQAARVVAQFKEIRHLLDGDVAIFRDDPEVPDQGWSAWEFSDPRTGDAVLFAFRQGSPQEHHAFTGARHWSVDLPAHGAVLLRQAAGSATAVAPGWETHGPGVGS